MPFLDHYILFLWCERLGCGLPLGYIILLAEAEQLSQIIVLLTQHRQHRRCKCRSVRRNKDKACCADWGSSESRVFVVWDSVVAKGALAVIVFIVQCL